MNGFNNRIAAGQALAEALVKKDYADPVVLALPRGGVPVGLEVARTLGAPLDLVMVRKIGFPYQPELAVAAVVNGAHPELVVNEDIAAHTGLSRKELDRLAGVQLEEIKRRAQIPVEGRTAIIVDDGIATGATVRASLRAVRRRKPAKLVLAVPVAPADTLDALRGDVDEIICLETPEFFYAIGAHYIDFGQVPDEEVVRLLAEADRVLSEKTAEPDEQGPPES